MKQNVEMIMDDNDRVSEMMNEDNEDNVGLVEEIIDNAGVTDQMIGDINHDIADWDCSGLAGVWPVIHLNDSNIMLRDNNLESKWNICDVINNDNDHNKHHIYEETCNLNLQIVGDEEVYC